MDKEILILGALILTITLFLLFNAITHNNINPKQLSDYYYQQNLSFNYAIIKDIPKSNPNNTSLAIYYKKKEVKQNVYQPIHRWKI